MKIAPSLMNMGLLHVEEDIKQLDPYADFYHADILDWHYVKNMCLSPQVIKEIRKVTNKPIEAHLYVDNLEEDLIGYCLRCGADIITMPSDIVGRSIHRFSKLIHDHKAKVGVFLNPSQSVSEIQQYSDVLDQLILLSVDPGFSGQDFVKGTFEKIADAKALRDASSSRYMITVDGGCNQSNFKSLFNAGADALVLGRGLFDRNANLEMAISEPHQEFMHFETASQD